MINDNINKLTLTYDSEKQFAVDVVVGSTRETIDLFKGRDLDINEKNVKEDMLKQPGKFAWYSALLADQEFKLAKSNRDLERRKAELSMQLRQGKLKLKTDSGEAIKLTEGAIDDYVTGDAKYKALQDEVHDLESVCKRLKALVSASVQRKDMLIEIGRLEIQERKQFGMGQ